MTKPKFSRFGDFWVLSFVVLGVLWVRKALFGNIFGKLENFRGLFIPWSFLYEVNSLRYFDLKFGEKGPFWPIGTVWHEMADFGVPQTHAPKSHTKMTDQILILSSIESLYRSLSSPGARYSMCTHQAHHYPLDQKYPLFAKSTFWGYPNLGVGVVPVGCTYWGAHLGGIWPSYSLLITESFIS